jgi:general secretion pathway protein A
MILRSYLQNADKDKQKTIYIMNPKLTFDRLLNTVLKELGVEPVSGQPTEMVSQLHEFLIEEYRNDRTVVLMIDEAQNMPVETLENIRMLSNLETSTEKLIQILLVGQPELETLLDRYDLRQLRERIAIRTRIVPLTRDESFAYIEHRLRNAGKEDTDVFSRRALDLIVKTAQGFPRRLNILCDNALITGHGYQESTISPTIAKEVIADLQGHLSAGKRFRPALAAAMLAALALPVAYLVYTFGTQEVPTSVASTNSAPLYQLLASPAGNSDPIPSVQLVSEPEIKKSVSNISPSDRMELTETARLLAVLLDCGRVVVGRAQPAINNPRLEDKGFSSTVFEAQLRKEFLSRTRHDLHNLAAAPMPERAKPLLHRLAFFMQKAVHDVQHDINKKGIGFKGFIPATFATQVADRFSSDTGLKLRQIGPPGTEPRNPNNKPDDQEEELLYAIQKNHPRVGDHAVEQQLGDAGVRVMLPLFYSRQCLSCHGSPKGELDISGYEKEGFKDGDLGGALSVLFPAKLAKSYGNESNF